MVAGGYVCFALRHDLTEAKSIEAGDTNDKLLLAGAVLLWIFAALYCLILLCNLKSLRVSIRIIETAADFFADTKRVALVPVFFFFVAIGTTFAWLYGYICVLSIGTITPENISLQSKHIVYG